MSTNKERSRRCSLVQTQRVDKGSSNVNRKLENPHFSYFLHSLSFQPLSNPLVAAGALGAMGAQMQKLWSLEDGLNPCYLFIYLLNFLSLLGPRHGPSVCQIE